MPTILLQASGRQREMQNCAAAIAALPGKVQHDLCHMQVCGLMTTKLGQNNRLSGRVADGATSMAAGFASKAVAMFESKQLNSNDIIKITNQQLSKSGNEMKMMVLDFEVVGKHTGEDLLAVEGQPPAKRAATASTMKAAATPGAPVSPSECASYLEQAAHATLFVCMPIGAFGCGQRWRSDWRQACRMPNTPAPVGAPAREFSFPTPGSALNTPTAASPVAFSNTAKENGTAPAGTLPVASSNVKHQPIESLNPYRSTWTIRAKVDRKQDKKQATIKGEVTSILTVTLVDQSVRSPAGLPFRARFVDAASVAPHVSRALGAPASRQRAGQAD